jgi:hypothetical protein
MSDSSDEAGGSTICPICGGPAERGCLYCRGGIKGTIWMTGPFKVKNKWLAALGVGEGRNVGRYGILTGHHIEGIRCAKCRRLILPDS